MKKFLKNIIWLFKNDLKKDVLHRTSYVKGNNLLGAVKRPITPPKT